MMDHTSCTFLPFSHFKDLLASQGFHLDANLPRIVEPPLKTAVIQVKQFHGWTASKSHAFSF
jgi:hypothetical protein